MSIVGGADPVDRLNAHRGMGCLRCKHRRLVDQDVYENRTDCQVYVRELDLFPEGVDIADRSLKGFQRRFLTWDDLHALLDVCGVEYLYSVSMSDYLGISLIIL